MGTYLLDANVFIEAHQRYYAFPVCPGFWESLLYHHRDQTVLSIDKIKDELKCGKKEDVLKEWITEQVPDSFFASIEDQAIASKFAEIMEWATESRQFTRGAIKELADVADGWLVAYACVNDCVVVTHETYDENTKKRIKIPNICQQFGVQWVNTFEMLKKLHVSYHWVEL